MRVRIHRTDGKTGSYSQDDHNRAVVLLKRLDPHKVFHSGPIVVGEHNPFSVLNPDHINWVEVEAPGIELQMVRPPGIERIVKLSGRHEYEELLERQWPRWRVMRKSQPGDLMEGLVQIDLRGGSELYLRVTGVVTRQPLSELVFGQPAVTAHMVPDGAVYVNPRSIVRARVYHSLGEVQYPTGLWFAEADDI
jgi:hypothetical protein